MIKVCMCVTRDNILKQIILQHKNSWGMEHGATCDFPEGTLKEMEHGDKCGRTRNMCSNLFMIFTTEPWSKNQRLHWSFLSLIHCRWNPTEVNLTLRADLTTTLKQWCEILSSEASFNHMLHSNDNEILRDICYSYLEAWMVWLMVTTYPAPPTSR